MNEKNKKEVSRDSLSFFDNKLLLISVILLPILVLTYIISLHSYDLVNERISSFCLVGILVFSVLLVYGIVDEIKKPNNMISKMIKLALSSLYVVLFLIIGLILYGSNSQIRNYIIDSAMKTKDHQYFATWLFSAKTIDETLMQAKEETKTELESSNKIEFEKVEYNQKIYANKYEEQILSKENEDDLYKIIKINGTTIGANYKYRGYLVAIYDPSKVKIATSSGAGTHDGAYGEILSIIAKKNKALIAMNAGGFYDPYWNSNGGIPHGLVIKDGKVLSEFRRGINSGGLIGFTKDNRLVLKNMSKEEALKMGIRDAMDWGPFLIVNGKNKFANVKNFTWGTSRSVIGQRKDGIVLFLVIDGGNQPGSYGASYADVAKIMANYGAYNAANLDGGTSTALVENNKYVNNPWNGYQRTIRSLPNAWIVVK